MIRPYRKAARAGDAEAITKIIELRAFKPKAKHTFMFHICIYLAIPVLVAISLMSDGNAGLYVVHEHGKVRPSNRQEDLQMRLRSFQKRGIFTPMIRSE